MSFIIQSAFSPTKGAIMRPLWLAPRLRRPAFSWLPTICYLQPSAGNSRPMISGPSAISLSLPMRLTSMLWMLYSCALVFLATRRSPLDSVCRVVKITPDSGPDGVVGLYMSNGPFFHLSSSVHLIFPPTGGGKPEPSDPIGNRFLFHRCQTNASETLTSTSLKCSTIL